MLRTLNSTLVKAGLLKAGLCLAAVASTTPAAADVIIGPRIAYYFDNSNLRTSDGTDQVLIAQQGDELSLQNLQNVFQTNDVALDTTFEGEGVTANQIGFAMVGGMINFGDDRDRFTISAGYGEGSGELQLLSATTSTLSVGDTSITDIATQTLTGSVDYKRIDLEATWQRRQSEQFAIFAGVRFERIQADADINIRSAQTGNIASEIQSQETGMFVPPQSGVLEFATTNEAELLTVSGRAGATMFAPFGDNAVAFANGMLHASYQPAYTARIITRPLSSASEDINSDFDNPGEVSFGPDIAVGAQFILSNSLALDVRYRAVLFFPVSGDQSFSDARVNHGLNLGLSLRL